MGIAEKAAQLAQENARAARAKNTEAREAYVKTLEDMLTARTGLTATHVGPVDVAHLAMKYPNGSYGGPTRVVEMEKWERLQIDDVFMLARKNQAHGYEFYLDREDPTRGRFRPEYVGSMYFSCWEDSSVEERQEKFVEALSREGLGKHPAVVLIEAGDHCNTCGRGW